MLKGIAIGILIMIGVLDVMLFVACFKLEHENEEREKDRKRRNNERQDKQGRAIR